MAVRQDVRDFIALGRLPESATADATTIQKHEESLLRIERPVSQEEAVELLQCFGPDECFGLAWTLLHLIESAPDGAPLETKPDESDNEWLRLLWDRAHR